MATRIEGDNIRCPGNIFLENPSIGINKALATGPNGEIITVNVPASNLELLSQVYVSPEPDSISRRDGDGNLKATSLLTTNVVPETAGDALNLSGANGADGDGAGGNVVIAGGLGGVENGAGGSVVINGGNSPNAGPGGSVTITGGGSDGLVELNNIFRISKKGTSAAQIDVTAVAGTLTLQQMVDPATPNSNFVISSGDSDSASNHLVLRAGSSLVPGDVRIEEGLDGGDGSKIYLGTGLNVRVFRNVLQLRSPDDNLFYDVVIRIIASVPTLVVEGSGEA